MPAAAAAVGVFFASTAAAVTAVTSTVVLGLTIGTWATIGTVALGAAATLSAASAAKKAAASLASTGAQLDLKLDVNAPVPFALGRTATGGYIVDQWVAGSKNSDANFTVVLSGGGVIEGVEKYVSGDYTLNWSGDPSSGSQASAASTTPSSELYQGKLKQAWFRGTASDGEQLTGLAHVKMTAVYDTKRFPQGIPESLWVLKGLKLYDPRKDSTFPGGSGSHRWQQPSTYEWTENPFIHALNYVLGYYITDSASNVVRIGGIGAPVDEVDFSPFLSGASLADSLGWKIGGVISTADDKFAVLNAILAAGSGEAVVRGASISCIYNAPKTVVDTITHDDIAETCEITNTAAWRDRKNRLVPSYRAESSGWEYVTGSAVAIPVWVAEDGDEIRSKEIRYDLVQDASQAQQLAAYDLVNTREFLTFSLVCKPRLLNVRVGDCVNVVLPGQGIVSQKCLVTAREFDPATYRVKLALRSETDTKHAWALGLSDEAPTTPSLGGYDPANPDAPEVGAWNIFGTTITGTDGVAQPAIIAAGVVDDPNAASVIFEYRKYGATDWTHYAELPITTMRLEMTGLEAVTAYEVAISYRTVLGVVAESKLILGPVTTGANTIPWQSNAITGRPDWMFSSVWAPFHDHYVPQIVLDYANTVAEVQNDILELQQNTGQLALEGYAKRDELETVAEASIQNILNDVAEEVETKRRTYLDGIELGSVVVSERTRTDDVVETLDLIGVKNANGTAIVFNTDKVQVGNGVSLASKLIGLESATANATAIATQQFNTLATSVSAESNARIALASTVANNAAVANQQFSTLSNTTTALAQFDSLIGVKNAAGNAVVLNTDKVLLTPTESLATRNALTEARFGGTSSSYLLSTASTAASTASSAASTLTQMGATLGNGSAFRMDSTKIDVSGWGTLAQTVSSLNSSISGKPSYADVSASVSSQVTAATGPGSALASQITSASTTANGASSNATLALNAANGNSSSAILTVGAGGKISGFKVNGSTGSFGVIASNFSVTDNSGASPTVPFAVIGGTTYMDSVVARNIGAGTITADKIVGGAVTNLVVNEYVGQVYFSTSEMEHLSFSYFCEGGKISLDVYCEVGTNTSTPAGAVYRLYCDSSVYNAGAVYCTPSWGQLGSTTPVVVNPGYGSHTFRVTYQSTPGSGSIRANRTYVRLTELKK